LKEGGGEKDVLLRRYWKDREREEKGTKEGGMAGVKDGMMQRGSGDGCVDDIHLIN